MLFFNLFISEQYYHYFIPKYNFSLIVFMIVFKIYILLSLEQKYGQANFMKIQQQPFQMQGNQDNILLILNYIIYFAKLKVMISDPASFSIADEALVSVLKANLSQQAQVLTSGLPGWSNAITSFNRDAQLQTPSFYIYCATQSDVLETIKFAHQNNLQLTPRSGGHNLGNFSLLQGGVVLDVKKLNKITHSVQNSTVTYGTGCKFGDVDQYIFKNLPGYAFVGAMDPSIGTAGARSALGVGWLQRLLGNGIDNIVAVKVALANGEIVIANNQNNTDLFFAVRGAASNYGVVLEITEKLHFILDPEQGNEVLYGAHFYPIELGQEIYTRVLELTKRQDLPDSAFILPVLHYVDGKRGLSIFFAHYKYDSLSKTINSEEHWTEAQLRKIQKQYNGLPINPFTSNQGWGYVSHPQLQRKAMNIPWGSSFYPCGGFVSDNEAQNVTSSLIKSWRESNIPSFAEKVPFHSTAFYHFGGKIQRNRNSESTAWPGNKNTALLTVTWGGWKNLEEKQEMINWVKNQWKDLYKNLQFGYLCAAAFDWKSKSYAKFVYGENYEKLREVKKKYDPQNFFRHNVNIPPK